MKTFIYFVRHGESPFIEGMERTRGLSERGKLDALKVDEILKAEKVKVYISSPYERAIQTINMAAANNEIVEKQEHMFHFLEIRGKIVVSRTRRKHI